MKTAVSLPERVFRDAERLARRLKKSRSRLYAEAIAEYVARHDPKWVTEKIDEVLTSTPMELDPLVRETSRRVLARTEWQQ